VILTLGPVKLLAQHGNNSTHHIFHPGRIHAVDGSQTHHYQVQSLNARAALVSGNYYAAADKSPEPASRPSYFFKCNSASCLARSAHGAMDRAAAKAPLQADPKGEHRRRSPLSFSGSLCLAFCCVFLVRSPENAAISLGEITQHNRTETRNFSAKLADAECFSNNDDSLTFGSN
jgi:hypothetical protein